MFVCTSIVQAWKRVRGGKGEKDTTPLRGSGVSLPWTKIWNISYLKHKSDAFWEKNQAELQDSVNVW